MKAEPESVSIGTMKKFRSAQEALGVACCSGNVELARASIAAGALSSIRSFKKDGTVVRNVDSGQLVDDELSAEQLAELSRHYDVLVVLPGYNVKPFAQLMLGKACVQGDVSTVREALRFADPNLAWYRIDGELDGVETPAILASRRELKVASAILKLLMTTPGADKQSISQVLLGIAIKNGDDHLCRRALAGGADRNLHAYNLFGQMTNDKSSGSLIYHGLAGTKLAHLSGHNPLHLLSDLPSPRMRFSFFFDGASATANS